MASEESKTVLECWWYFAEIWIKKNKRGRSEVFQFPHSAVSFFLQLNQKANLSLHLATCPQKKLHIDKFEIKAYKGSAEELYRFEVNGDINLNGETEVVGRLDELKNWRIAGTITYKEPSHSQAMLVPELLAEEHQKQLLDELAISRMYPDQSGLMTLETDDGQDFPVHKDILAVRWPVFAAMFKKIKCCGKIE